jgi:hypothetical protein
MGRGLWVAAWPFKNPGDALNPSRLIFERLGSNYPGALTQRVNAIEVIHDRFHAAWQEVPGSQLPFSGLSNNLESVCNGLGG